MKTIIDQFFYQPYRDFVQSKKELIEISKFSDLESLFSLEDHELERFRFRFRSKKAFLRELESLKTKNKNFSSLIEKYFRHSSDRKDYFFLLLEKEKEALFLNLIESESFRSRMIENFFPWPSDSDGRDFLFPLNANRIDRKLRSEIENSKFSISSFRRFIERVLAKDKASLTKDVKKTLFDIRELFDEETEKIDLSKFFALIDRIEIKLFFLLLRSIFDLNKELEFSRSRTIILSFSEFNLILDLIEKKKIVFQFRSNVEIEFFILESFREFKKLYEAIDRLRRIFDLLSINRKQIKFSFSYVSKLSNKEEAIKNQTSLKLDEDVELFLIKNFGFLKELKAFSSLKEQVEKVHEKLIKKDSIDQLFLIFHKTLSEEFSPINRKIFSRSEKKFLIKYLKKILDQELSKKFKSKVSTNSILSAIRILDRTNKDQINDLSLYRKLLSARKINLSYLVNSIIKNKFSIEKIDSISKRQKILSLISKEFSTKEISRIEINSKSYVVDLFLLNLIDLKKKDEKLKKRVSSILNQNQTLREMFETFKAEFLKKSLRDLKDETSRIRIRQIF